MGTENNNFKDVANKPYFDTYPNFNPATGKETMLKFTLVYDSPTKLQDEKEFFFIINRDPAKDPGFTNNSGHVYIKSGYEYQIKINATLTSNTISCSVICFVTDWIKTSFTIDMTEI